jgi:SAM-dependent methyltransferase
MSNSNVDIKTVDGFGDEWARFDQSDLGEDEHKDLFDNYFSIFPWDKLVDGSEGFDLGCGSGRWAMLVAPRVGKLHCIDPSVALDVAKRNLSKNSNCEFHKATVDAIPLKDSSMDFGYSLGVLHHVPNTEMGIVACVKKLKPGAPFLLYLYYDFENRPLWFRFVWRVSDIFRRIVSRLPHGLRYFASQIIALFVYYPIARLSKFIEILGGNASNFPLSSYRHLSFYTMRTDALDRFGTRLEQRFSRASIKSMMERSGLENVIFSNHEPYWCAIGYRKLSDIGAQ